MIITPGCTIFMDFVTNVVESGKMKRSIVRFFVSQVFTAHSPKISLHFAGAEVGRLYSHIPGFSFFETWRYRWYIKQFTKMTNVECTINTERLRPYLVDFGFNNDRIFHKEDPWNPIFFKPQAHKGINVLWYLPTEKKYRRKLVDYIYGAKYLEELIRRLPDVNFIIANGSMDMKYIYSITDCYVKINQMPHQDMNRIGKECLSTGIPVKMFDVWDNHTIEDIIVWINTRRGIRNTKKEKEANS